MSFLKSITSVLSPPNKAAYPLLARSFLSTVILRVLSRLFHCRYLKFFSKCTFIFSGFCLYFFRDPKRFPPQSQNAIVAPADGRIVSVEKIVPPKELEIGDTPRWRVGIFLSVLNVHINRIPLSGRILKIAYHEGQFLNASFDKASEKNERNALSIECHDGRTYGVVQIAGFIARRIICHKHEKENVRTGERFGLICFGSRTDLYLPDGCEPVVQKGQIMIGGETIISHLK